MSDSIPLYAIDSLLERDGLLFGWGWIWVPGQVVSDAWISVCTPETSGLEGGETSARIECSINGIRSDVAPALGVDGIAFGFTIAGRLPADWLGGTALLHVRTEDATLHELQMPQFPQGQQQEPGAMQRMHNRLRQLRNMCREADFRQLGLRAYAKARDEVEALLPSSPESTDPTPPARSELVVDHSMGGGANKYADKLISGLLEQEVSVVVLKPELPTLSYSVEHKHGRGSSKRSFPALVDAIEYLNSERFAKIHCNHFVSFESVSELFDFCARQANTGAEVVTYVHDYFSICPSWVLMNEKDEFCGIPELDVCKTCLPRNPVLFGSYYRTGGVASWREAWGNHYSLSSEIIAFSDSSRKLLLKVFPEIEGKLVVRAHTVDLAPTPNLVWHPSGKKSIGVFGHISRHKGADVLVEMARLAYQQGLDLEFLVFGSLSAQPKSPQLRVVGGYESSEMFRLAMEYNLLAGFVPSVCSETFSFVTAELMHIGLPVAVFDRGAPADRVRGYRSGLVLGSTVPLSALDELGLFCEQQSVLRASQ